MFSAFNEEKNLRRLVAATVALGLGGGALFGLGCGEGSPEPTSDQAKTPAPKAARPFKTTHDWSLPKRVILSPRFKQSADECQDWWEDRSGKRRPVTSKDPLIVRADGRCNTPLDSESIGIYEQ